MDETILIAAYKLRCIITIFQCITGYRSLCLAKIKGARLGSYDPFIRAMLIEETAIDEKFE